MKKISFEDLGKYIGKKASKYFDKWYSQDIHDYIEDIVEEYIEEEDVYYCYVELCNVGFTPLIIRFYTRYVYDKKGNVIDTIYYL